MPAPLAKGLLISLSVIIAAGIAVYENPQVRQWVDSSRRKIAVALHNLGDEIGPRTQSQNSSPDPSTRPDASAEAEERRQRVRQEILERKKALQEKRILRNSSSSINSRSFDGLVDNNGALLNEKSEAHCTATDTKPQTDNQDLRKRNGEANAVGLGSVLANPFGDEMQIEHSSLGMEEAPDQSSPCSSIQSLPIPPASEDDNRPSSPASVDHDRPSPATLVIDTEVISNHPSEALLDLTPTTSVSSTTHAGLSETFIPVSANRTPWSVHEWAENTSSSFYSAAQSEGTGIDREGSEFGTSVSEEHLSHVGTDVSSDTWSEAGNRTDTPVSWTEVGSVVSDEF